MAQIHELVEDTVVEGRIVRHKLSSRVVHWLVAVSFLASLATGLPVWTPIFGWMAALFGGLAVCRWLHPLLGLGFFAASGVMFVHWLAVMRLEKGESAWLGPKLIEYLRFSGEDPDVGKYNGGQKIFFFIATALALLLVLSGVVLWYPLSFSAWLRELSWLVHDGAFILFVTAVVVHIYLGTAAEPGTFAAMTRGTVSLPWARLHHPRWYREVVGERPVAGDAKKPS
jgi:formate dehydrogenase subunit gamma